MYTPAIRSAGSSGCRNDGGGGESQLNRLRTPSKVSGVQRAARSWGQIWHDDGPVIPLPRAPILTRRPQDDYTDLDWLYQDQPKAS